MKIMYMLLTKMQNTIQKFDNDGNFILKWGGLGSENGQFIEPQELQ